MSLLILERSGKFHATHMRPNAHKCAAMRTRTYSYRVRIEASDAHLTPEGFLLNNEHVQTFFDERWGERTQNEWDAVSCELLALISAKELGAMLKREGTDLKKIECHIKGSNGAWITASCSLDDLN